MKTKLCCIVLYWILGVRSMSESDSNEAQIIFFHSPLVSTGKLSTVYGADKYDMGIDKIHQPFLWNKNAEWKRTMALPGDEDDICKYTYIKPLYCAPGLPVSNYPLYILQNINQFEYTSDEEKQFYQKFVINAQFYDNSIGHVILLIGDQSNIYVDTVTKDNWRNYAKQFKALLIYVEHRFWGRSSLREGEYSDDNLIYLNSEQVLADLAWFIVNFKSTYKGVSKTSRWIAYGLGRGGTLAARMRLKYPHLVYASVSSSSPLKEIPNFNEFYNNISSEFNTDNIKLAFIKLLVLLKKDNGISELEKKFKLCTKLNVNGNDQKNLEYFIWSLYALLGVVVEKGNDSGDEYYDIKMKVIRFMAKTKDRNSLTALASTISDILNFFTTKMGVNEMMTKCLNVDYKRAVELYKDASWNAVKKLDIQLKTGIGDRRMLYQDCTEFGQFRTVDEEKIGEQIKLEFYTGLCKDVFGDGFELINVAVDRTYMFYGGVDIQAKHLIFVNGGLDRNAEISITKSKKKGIVAIYHGDAHALADVKSYPLVFTDQQRKIIATLHEWLDERVVAEVSIN